MVFWYDARTFLSNENLNRVLEQLAGQRPTVWGVARPATIAPNHLHSQFASNSTQSYSYSILFMVQISPTYTTKIVLLLVPSFEEKKWIWIQLSTRYTDDVWTLSYFRSVLTPNGAVTLKRSVSEIYVPNRLQNIRPLRVPLGHIFDVPKKIPNLHSAYQQETNINWWELKINYNCRCVRNLYLLRASN